MCHTAAASRSAREMISSVIRSQPSFVPGPNLFCISRGVETGNVSPCVRAASSLLVGQPAETILTFCQCRRCGRRSDMGWIFSPTPPLRGSSRRCARRPNQLWTNVGSPFRLIACLNVAFTPTFTHVRLLWPANV